MAYINGRKIAFSARIGSGMSADEIIDMVYPVGSIYISTSSTSPETFMGGVWEQLKDRFLIGAGNTYSGGDIGGEVSHTLTVAEMPKHSHRVINEQNSENKFYARDGIVQPEITSGWHMGLTVAQADDVSGNAIGEPVGGGQAHNNMPPYLAVYMWKRTA